MVLVIPIMTLVLIIWNCPLYLKHPHLLEEHGADHMVLHQCKLGLINAQAHQVPYRLVLPMWWHGSVYKHKHALPYCNAYQVCHPLTATINYNDSCNMVLLDL
jgi:hypothetical protein